MDISVASLVCSAGENRTYLALDEYILYKGGRSLFEWSAIEGLFVYLKVHRSHVLLWLFFMLKKLGFITPV